jgi:integrase
MWEQHIEPVIGKRFMHSIKSTDIQYVIAKAHEHGKASKTMKHIRTVMSCGFRQAVADGIIGKSPLQPGTIQIPEKQKKPLKVLTPKELELLMGALGKSRWLPSVKFILATGTRRGEMLALKWDDIDFDNKRITIKNSLDRHGVDKDTKAAKEHYIPISKRALNALNDQKFMLMKEGNTVISRINKKSKNETLRIDVEEESNKVEEPAWVFPNRLGEALHPASYYTTIARAAESVNIKASPHMLRHTFVYYARSSLSLKDLQNVLGHESTTTTLDIYGDMINDQTEEMASVIDTAFERLDQAIVKINEEDKKKNRNSGKVLSFGSKN